ncbi:MAG: metal-binding protein [Clostridiaceae bacterium]
MTILDVMKYVESEFSIITKTPCEICGGDYITEDIDVYEDDGILYDYVECICSNCGFEKNFKFTAPFIEDPKDEKKLNEYKTKYN